MLKCVVHLCSCSKAVGKNQEVGSTVNQRAQAKASREVRVGDSSGELDTEGPTTSRAGCQRGPDYMGHP